MTDITIPPAALRAARAASMNALGDGDDSVNAACLAMLRAALEAIRMMDISWVGDAFKLKDIACAALEEKP